ncbi:MAG: hypothetical protein RLN88_13815 [Ekhidna sp.]|uniref:hypothetical protein n=1 Tax=Ekhidna sp. TaxID=2608089 RepID=UPI0032EB4D36
MKGKILFKEEQSFVNTWMWYLVLSIMALSLGGVILGYIRNPNSEGVVALIITIVVAGGVVLLLFSSRLHTSIDQDRIYYRFPPFVRSERSISKEDVKEIYVRKYQPIWEYGGWGYRIRLGKGKALNVAGDYGLQLVLSDGKKLLIGTQKPEAMEHALRRLKENWGIDG